MNFIFIKYLLLITLFLITINLKAFSQVRFAAIGDYGSAGPNELAVANLVKSWNPDFIITLGDNNYEVGSDSTIDANIGQYYHEYIYPYKGSYGDGSLNNKFYPSLGNHDWAAQNAEPYLNYFELPGNERYYDFTEKNIHFFVLDSDPNEPDGIDENSLQAKWLKDALQNSSSQMWNVVYFHHPPYSSGPHGSTAYMRWPFRKWGADIILSGHEHNYERLYSDSLFYVVNGLGGKSIYSFLAPIPESLVRYNDNYGAMFIESSNSEMIFKFINVNGFLIDSFKITRDNLIVKPERFYLYQNSPNPFNSNTIIKYNIPEQGKISLKVFDILGNEISTLVDEYKTTGFYEVNFDASKLASGIYLYKLQLSGVSLIKKMVLIR